MSNGDDAMTSAEFAKLMGAYPEPAGNPLPTYGGFMDNSAANFSWVQNNDYFGAEDDERFVITKWTKNVTGSGEDRYTKIKPDADMVHKFRLLDDDMNIYAYGYSNDDSSFEPLDQTGGYGLVHIEYYEPKTKTYEMLAESFNAEGRPQGMTSTRFRHKETGEIATQIPISEMRMWEKLGAETFEEEYECSWCGKDVKKGDKFYFVDGAWTTDALCVSCKEEGDDEDADWGKLNIEDGTWDAETFGAFSIDKDDEGKIHIENKCDGCGKDFQLTQNPNLIGGNRAGAIVYDHGINGYPEYSPHGDLLCKSCWKINKEEDENADSRGQGQYGAEGESLLDLMLKKHQQEMTEQANCKCIDEDSCYGCGACYGCERGVGLMPINGKCGCGWTGKNHPQNKKQHEGYEWTDEGQKKWGKVWGKDAESKNNECDVCETNKLLFEMTDMAANEVLCQSCIQDGHDSHWTIKTHIPETFPVDSEAYKTPKTEVGYTVGAENLSREGTYNIDIESYIDNEDELEERGFSQRDIEAMKQDVENKYNDGDEVFEDLKTNELDIAIDGRLENEDDEVYLKYGDKMVGGVESGIDYVGDFGGFDAESFNAEGETTCASCGGNISEEDIIGDGTNRGLCCVPDYYDDLSCDSCGDIVDEVDGWHDSKKHGEGNVCYVCSDSFNAESFNDKNEELMRCNNCKTEKPLRGFGKAVIKYELSPDEMCMDCQMDKKGYADEMMHEYRDYLDDSWYKYNQAESFNAEGFINGIPAEEFYAELNEFYAEVDIVNDGMVAVSNKNDDMVGVIEVMDDKDDDEMVEISVQDENLEEIGAFTLDDGMVLDDEDNYLAEMKKPSLLALALGVGAVLLGGSLLKNKLVKNADIIESPNTGDLSPANYEELIVESTGYAVDIIPMSLDGSFMGSRFAALPTERYVEYNDPGIGAHTDIALDRNEMYLEPEMSMVQAAEGEIKEAQAPGQSPYLSMDGQEPKDFSYRVLKETHPVSLDPAVVPFIPQSMSGYTGNANRPPSVYNKMFNLGVLGQTPLFVPGNNDDIGASHTGSRRATPSKMGSIGGPLSDAVNGAYTDGQTSKSLAQWSIENSVQQTSDTEAIVIDRSSGNTKRIRRV